MGWNLMYGHLDVCSMHYSLDDHLSMYVCMIYCTYVRMYNLCWHTTNVCTYFPVLVNISNAHGYC